MDTTIIDAILENPQLYDQATFVKAVRAFWRARPGTECYDTPKDNRQYHRTRVRDALRFHKPVYAGWQAEYPDLAEKYKGAAK